jgi:hypothetical protein
MRNDINEALRRSREIESYAKKIPKKDRKNLVAKWLEAKDWELENNDEIIHIHFLEKIWAAKLLANQIVKYGYAWLPDTLKKTGKRISISTPTLLFLNMLARLSLIPVLYASSLPESPAVSFACYSLATVLVHENEVRILKKAPAVLSQYTSTLSLFFSPRISSLIYRGGIYLSHAILLLRPSEADKVLSAYFYYAAIWLFLTETVGSSVVYKAFDEKKASEDLDWRND